MTTTTGKKSAQAMAKEVADYIRQSPHWLELDGKFKAKLSASCKRVEGTTSLYESIRIEVTVALADSEISHSVLIPISTLMWAKGSAVEEQINNFLGDTLRYVKHRYIMQAANTNLGFE